MVCDKSGNVTVGSLVVGNCQDPALSNSAVFSYFVSHDLLFLMFGDALF
jgi:hypothetical protein